MGVSILLTEDEYLNLPDSPNKQELLDGELLELPPAKFAPTELLHRLMRLLEKGAAGGSRAWIEAGYRLAPGRWLIPDVSLTWPDQRVENDYLQGSPMIAIEIASRGNTAQELEQKTAAYLEHRAAEVWITFPKTRTMVVFRPESTVRIPADAVYRCEMLEVEIGPEYRTPMPTE